MSHTGAGVRRIGPAVATVVTAVVAVWLPGTASAGDGGLDPSFGTGGKVTTDVAGSDFARAIAIQPDGKILLAGNDGSAGGGSFALARYDADGTIDPTFGGGTGRVTTNFSPNIDFIDELALQPDGKIVAAGTANCCAGSGVGSSSVFALARYNPDGTLDTTFGAGTGKVTTDLPGIGFSHDFINGVTLDAAGRIVAGGYQDARFIVLRYLQNGSLDGTFGSPNGFVITPMGANASANDVMVDALGRIVASGRGGNNFALARYLTNGALDTSFGSSGTVFTSFGASADGRRARFDSSGRIVSVGIAGGNFALARHTSNGTPDTTFGGTGRITTSFGTTSGATGLGIQAVDGKIVAGGCAGCNTSSANFALARYNSDGSLDAAFGSAGKVTTDFAGAQDEAWAVALQTGGRIVAAGIAGVSGSLDFAAARYLVGAAGPASMTLDPAASVNPVGTSHTVTATVEDAGGSPVPDVTVRFSVTGSVMDSGSCTTDAAGQCGFTYDGPELPGSDAISAFADTDGDGGQDPGEPAGAATKTWVLPSSTPGCEVTIGNGGRITAENGDKATFGGNAVVESETQVSGEEEYRDHGPAEPLNLHGNVLAVVCTSDRTRADVFGEATLDGAGAFDFRIRLFDGGEAGRGTDTYGILVSNGYDSGERVLEGGNVQIQVHER